MRAQRELSYRVQLLPEVPEVLSWLVERAGLDDAAAYGTLNMGAGFALLVKAGAGATVTDCARVLGHSAILAGTVEEGPRQVILEPVGVTYSAAELDVR